MSVACLSEVSTAVCDGVAVLCALTAKAVYRVVRPGELDMLLLAARSRDMMASVMEVNEVVADRAVGSVVGVETHIWKQVRALLYTVVVIAALSSGCTQSTSTSLTSRSRKISHLLSDSWLVCPCYLQNRGESCIKDAWREY